MFDTGIEGTMILWNIYNSLLVDVW